MAGKAGFNVGGSATVISKNVFNPPDDKTKEFLSVELGYLGGAVRASCDRGVFNLCQEGAAVDFKGVLSGSKKGPKIDLVQVGEAGTLFRKAA